MQRRPGEGKKRGEGGGVKAISDWLNGEAKLLWMFRGVSSLITRYIKEGSIGQDG